MLDDVRHAFRVLARHPSFTAVACVTLGCGIGLNAVIFSVVDAALFRPMPYKAAERLVDVYRIAATPEGQRLGIGVRGRLVDVVRGFSEIFERVEVVRFARPILQATGVDQRLWVGGFGPALPDLLGVRPQIGRGFTREDVTAQATIVLSDGFWDRAFKRDPAVLGKTITISDHAWIVVGVMPPSFRHFLGAQTDAWLPIDDQAGSSIVGRLRPGLSVAQAQRQLDAAVARLPPGRAPLELQIVSADWERSATPPPGFLVKRPRAMLLSLMGALGFVLGIACTNVANLLLARTLTRQAEIALRAALGATRWQLVRQLLVEGLVLAALGGVVATVLAWVGIHLVPAIMPATLGSSLFDVSLPQADLRVLGFGLFAVLVAGLASGAVPAIRASGHVGAEVLLAGGRHITASRAQRRTSGVLQAVQIGLTLVLLVGAGLFVNSFLRMATTPAGFDGKHLLYAEFSFPPDAFALPAQQIAFADDLVARVSKMPGVRQATLGQPPAQGELSVQRLVPDGSPQHSARLRTYTYCVRPEYFRVAGITLREGRTFGQIDQRGAPKVIIVSENAATRLWPGRSAVGRQLDGLTVVGVVSHLKTIDFVNDGVELFYPLAQHDRYPPGLLVRTTGDAATLAALIRAEVRAIDPRVTVQDIGTVDNLFARSDPLGSSRFYATLLGSVAGLGLLTAAVGLYATLSFAVNQRTHEIGVRVALGAEAGNIGRLLIRDALGPVLLGIAAGLVAATWLSKFIGSQLFHVRPHDVTTYVAVVILLVIMCAVAALAPVARASRIDPADALRNE